jgi:DNA/RNA-binding domain of Phe-tRNA-synthetase-like protein
MEVQWSQEVSAKLAGLAVCVGVLNGIRNEKDDDQLRTLKRTVYAEVKADYVVEALKNDPTVRAYRDFYWRLGIDPTKTRPSGEALMRRVLNGNELPAAVDAYNLASMKTIVPISGFDKDYVSSPLQVRFARNSETFTGIGMTVPMTLDDKLLVLADPNQILCIYPYRDSDQTKIGMHTRNAMLIGYGTSGVAETRLREAVETALSFIRQVAGGEAEAVQIFRQ